MTEKGEKRDQTTRQKTGRPHCRQFIREHPIAACFFALFAGIGIGALITCGVLRVQRENREKRNRGKMMSLLITLAIPSIIRRLTR